MDSSKTLPASWFTSPNLYSLELRAVFLKSWYFLGTVNKFTPDQDVDYEFGKVSINVHCDSNDASNESFTITTTNNGSHENITLPHHLTPTGLLFTAISPSAPSFESWFPPSLLQLLNKHDFRRLPYRKTIRYPGRFNWKTMVDGYQECLHCQYTHRSFSVKYPPTFYEVHSHGTYSRHIADPKKPDDGLFLFFFPICTLNLYGGGMSSFRVCPTSEGETRMEFDYYYYHSGEGAGADEDGLATGTGTDTDGMEGFEEYYKFVRRVAMEDFELCETAQGNLERGVYSQGVLNAEKESGVLHYQNLVRRMVVDQWKKEEEERNALTPVASAVDGIMANGEQGTCDGGSCMAKRWAAAPCHEHGHEVS